MTDTPSTAYPMTAELRCRCGAVRGRAVSVSPRAVNRAICYCDDCQAFAHHLGRPDLLDPQGGTNIVQLAPASLAILQGHDRVSGVRLTPKGLYRWTATCCNTPLGNMVSPAIPFVGVVTMSFDLADRSAEQVFGKPVGAIRGEYAIGEPPAGSRGIGLWIMTRSVGKVLRWRLAGKTWPHPLFRSRESEADVSGDVAVARTAPGVTPTVWAETGILGWTFVGREPAALEQLKTLRSTVDDADQRSASSIDEQRDINIHIGTSVREAIVEFSADFVSPPVGIPNETPGSTPAIARRSRLPSHHPGRNRIYRNDMRGRKPSLAHLLLAAAHVAARRSVDRQVRLLRFRLLTICGVSVKYAAR